MLYVIVAYVSWFSSLIPIFALRSWRHLNDNFVAALIGLASFSFMTDSALYFLRTKGESNIAMMNAYALIEFLVIGVIFFILHKQRRSRVGISAVVVSVLVYCFCLGVYSGETEGVTWQINVATAFPAIIGSLLLLLSAIRSQNKTDLWHQYRFWLACALLLYFFGNLTVFIFSELILDPLASAGSRSLWMLHNVIHVAYNLLIAKTVVVWRKASSSPTLSPASQ